jgi:hypothetical protein
MLVDPRVGQRVRVKVEYRDEFPVYDIGHLEGVIAGIGNWPMVNFKGRDGVIHVPNKFLELIDG